MAGIRTRSAGQADRLVMRLLPAATTYASMRRLGEPGGCVTEKNYDGAAFWFAMAASKAPSRPLAYVGTKGDAQKQFALAAGSDLSATEKSELSEARK